MSDLKCFLEEACIALKDWKSLQEIHIVIGNESCDLDSTVSAIAYGYLLHKKYGFETIPEKVVLPILNVDRDNFAIRLEHCHLLKEVNIDPETLIYRSEVNFSEMTEHFNVEGKIMKTYLVDHHVLSMNDKDLKCTVCQIIDHRPMDVNHGWTNNVEMRIEPVGSCTTLIADEIFKENENIWIKELAYLIYCTILLDTKRLKCRATYLDTEIASKLEKKFNLNHGRKVIYERLKDLHCDTGHLSPYQMLVKDLKFIGTNILVAIPRICVLAENFIKIEGALDSLKEFSVSKKCSIIVLIGSEQYTEEQKDLGVFLNSNHIDLVGKLTEKLKLAGLQRISSEFYNFLLFKFLHKKMTRKEIVPIIMEVLNQIED